MRELQGMAAVVTGGANGIGRGIARALAAEGVNVVVADLDGAAAQTVADELSGTVRAIAVPVDVTEPDTIEALADRAWSEMGRVDILVSNAGIFPPRRSVLNIEEADARWVIEVNLFGMWACCKTFGRRFVEQGTPAWILATGSENSVGVPHTHGGFYTASKHAVLGLMDVMRRELPDHIGASVLCPGMVATTLGESLARRPSRYGGPVAVGAMGSAGSDPDEIGRLAVAGMQRGDFYIFTHPPVRELVDERYVEVVTAFETHCPRYEGDEALDTRAFMARLRR